MPATTGCREFSLSPTMTSATAAPRLLPDILLSSLFINNPECYLDPDDVSSMIGSSAHVISMLVSKILILVPASNYYYQTRLAT